MHLAHLTLLAIDATMGSSSAALLRSGEAPLLALRSSGAGREQAESLFAMIGEVMTEAGVTFRDLERLAVTTGPGSFSGVRTGLSAARGLALALGIGIVGASGLEVMAFDYLGRAEREAGKAFAVAAPAGRAGVYLQCFSPTGAPLGKAVAGQVDEVLSSIPAEVAIAAGAGAEILADAAAKKGRNLKPVTPDLAPSAASLARLAIARTPGASPPAPFYLRPPDAKPQQSKILARASAAPLGLDASS